MRLLPLVLLLLVLPLAAADHVFSHRVVVAGRVVDAEGMPAPALPVTVRIVGMPVAGKCFDSREERTGPQGDFVVCRHAHVAPQGVRVNVTVGNASAEAPLDPALRRVAFHLRLPDARPARDIEGERLFARTFHVEGRVMRVAEGNASVEGVNVTALPEGGQTARVALESASGALASANATVNEHGDYSIDLEASDVPEGARVRVAVAGGEHVVPADVAFRRADVDLVLGAMEPPTTETRPGERTPDVPLGGALALTALAAAAVLGGRARRR